MKGMTTCKVCGRDFPLLVEDHYVAKDPGKTGLAAVLGHDEELLYDAFNCPHCGCQNVVQGRKRVCPCDECEQEGSDEEGHDGCSGCAHEDVPEGEYPCNECTGSFADLYEKRDKE